MPKPTVKSLKVLSARKAKKEADSFLLEGWRHIDEALKAGSVIESVVIEEGRSLASFADSVLNELRARSIPLRLVSSKKIKKLTSSVHAQGVVAVVRKREWTFDDLIAQRLPVVLALDSISDPGNFGTLLRTAEWFGVTGVLASTTCVNLYNEKVLRSAVGSMLHLLIVQELNLAEAVRRLRTEGYKAFALDADGTVDYRKAQYSNKSVVIAGNEAYGISPEVRTAVDGTVKIPRIGKSESLNVAVATGIVLSKICLNAQ